jgi:anaerobic selenocysteine-containing dehydrogenase
VEVNTEDARVLSLDDGDWVALINELGARIEAPVITTGNLRRGVLRARYGWGDRSDFIFGLAKNGYNLNELTSADQVHPITGNACFGELAVRIEKIQRGTE